MFLPSSRAVFISPHPLNSAFSIQSASELNLGIFQIQQLPPKYDPMNPYKNNNTKSELKYQKKCERKENPNPNFDEKKKRKESKRVEKQ